MKNKHDKLFYKYLDGMLSEEEKLELNNILREDDEACERLKLLSTVSEGLSEYSYNPSSNVTKQSFRSFPWLISLAATIVAVLSFLKTESPPDYKKPEVSTIKPLFMLCLLIKPGLILRVEQAQTKSDSIRDFTNWMMGLFICVLLTGWTR